MYPIPRYSAEFQIYRLSLVRSDESEPFLDIGTQSWYSSPMEETVEGPQTELLLQLYSGTTSIGSRPMASTLFKYWASYRELHLR
jgi:hypothetical protein